MHLFAYGACNAQCLLRHEKRIKSHLYISPARTVGIHQPVAHPGFCQLVLGTPSLLPHHFLLSSLHIIPLPFHCVYSPPFSTVV